jgi:hypothetical protein
MASFDAGFGGGGGGFIGTGGGFGTGGGTTSSGGGNATGGNGGGGSATGGAGGGSATGGGSGTGGGTAVQGGSGSFLNVGFNNHHLASGADGREHLVFVDGAAQRVLYGVCSPTGNCSVPASWNPVVLKTAPQLSLTTVGPYGLGVDASNRVHVLISGVTPLGQFDNAIVYATCATNCSTVSNWTFVDLSSLTTVRNNAVQTVNSFMVEQNGRVSFLTADPGIYFACSSGCSALSGWSSATVLTVAG